MNTFLSTQELETHIRSAYANEAKSFITQWYICL